MTKQELIRMLEPFDDDIRIEIFEHNGLSSFFRVFYNLNDDCYARLIISTFKPELKKVVELK